MKMTANERQLYNTLLGLVDEGGVVRGLKTWEIAELADLPFKDGPRNNVSSRISALVKSLEKKRLVKRIPSEKYAKQTDYIIRARYKGEEVPDTEEPASEEPEKEVVDKAPEPTLHELASWIRKQRLIHAESALNTLLDKILN